MEKITLLIIDDDYEDALFISKRIKKGGDYAKKLEHVTTLGKGIEILKREEFDIILLDLTLPDSYRLNTLDALCSLNLVTPIIVFTGLHDTEVGLAAIRRGAQDYLIKGQITTENLRRTIYYAIERKRNEIEHLQEQKEELKKKEEFLGYVLNHIEAEKQKIKDEVMDNIDYLIMPTFDKFSAKGIDNKYLELQRKNLKEITSSFAKKISLEKFKLTRREIEICNVIRNGLTNKETAHLLNIDLQTVEKHRQKIRKKLNLINKGINLATYLQNF